MTENSIYLFVKNEGLEHHLKNLSENSRFLSKPIFDANQASINIWLKYKETAHYFSIQAAEINSEITIIDFDCQSRAFIDMLIDTPKKILMFFLTLMQESIEVHWVATPPDFSLKEIYEQLAQGKLSHCSIKKNIP